MKLTCVHADTCLPDCWGGHHLPHVAVPVHRRMIIGQLREAIIDELNAGAVAGADATPAETYENKTWLRAARAAVRRDVKMRKSGARYPFCDLPENAEDCNAGICDACAYAYFVFTGD